MSTAAELAELKEFIKDEWRHMSGEQRSRVVAHLNALECELMEHFDPAGYSSFEPVNPSNSQRIEARSPSPSPLDEQAPQT
jgi:hypothetical protein